jgi:hypothetical protein
MTYLTIGHPPLSNGRARSKSLARSADVRINTSPPSVTAHQQPKRVGDHPRVHTSSTEIRFLKVAQGFFAVHSRWTTADLDLWRGIGRRHAHPLRRVAVRRIQFDLVHR